ncbi:DNA mismatch repair protein [Acrasis kona]|uniref:DNA mismatch repair protein n=1 Tax=Acrasis kona TaxID=1008807 RepID=A0AAW2YKI2_9EUKA
MINHLKTFKLERMMCMPGMTFNKLTNRYEMNINGVTLNNLEILQNNANASEKGSLYWLMNHTCTPFGSRLLKHWICHPLYDSQSIQDRLDAIHYIQSESNVDQHLFISSLPILMRSLPDLEKALMRVEYGKCSPKEFLALLKSFERLGEELPNQDDIESINCPLIKNLLMSIPDNLAPLIEKFLSSFNHSAVETMNYKGLWNKRELFLNMSGYPEIEEQQEALCNLKNDLNKHLEEIRELLGKPNLVFKDLHGKRDLVEIKVSEMRMAKSDWLKTSQTKSLVRYQTPFVIKHQKEVQYHKELLEKESSNAWNNLLLDFCEHYEPLKRTVAALAQFDCLLSLSELSSKKGYIRPEFTKNTKSKLKVVNGRHPMIEMLLEEQDQEFIPNDAHMDATQERCMIITGPNMGGKSSYIKSMAIIVLMAHIGSYVPADECELSMFDAIYTRMGASDDMSRGHSTFFVELSEAGECLRDATERSLVVMDELGRGTSTHDGTAIAYATLERLVCGIGCLNLFVTHYPLLTTMSFIYPDLIKNYHLSYSGKENQKEVKFLYKLVNGSSPKSYGLNVAKLAGLSAGIIDLASDKSDQLERETMSRMTSKCFNRMLKYLDSDKSESIKDVQSHVRELIPGIADEKDAMDVKE